MQLFFSFKKKDNLTELDMASGRVWPTALFCYYQATCKVDALTSILLALYNQKEKKQGWRAKPSGGHCLSSDCGSTSV